MKNLRIVRELWGLSQGNVAEDTGVSQQSYARYEKGQTDKPPYDFIKNFAHQYMVSEAWLKGNAPPYDCSRTTVMIADRLPEAAKRLRLPQPFLAAICSGEVLGSGELYMTIESEFSGERVITPATRSERDIREIFKRIETIETLLKHGDKSPNMDSAEAALLSAYRRLNARGQSEAVKRVLELSGLPCYSSDL